MKCSHAKKMISRYMDQDLNPDEKMALDLHVDECLFCNEELEHYVTIHNLFGSAERFEVPLGFASAVMSRIEEKKNSTPYRATIKNRQSL